MSPERRNALRALPSYAGILVFAASSRLLARLPLPRLEALVDLRRRAEPLPDNQVDALAHRIERVLWATQRLLRHTCLTRGLTRYYFLRRAGADVRLVFGIGEIAEGYAGHCWLLLDDRVYQEATDPALHFADVITLPAASGS